jgi:glycosyltransferase involved in cell wall biosynthesis
MTDNPLVTIAVCTYNRARLLSLCLESLSKLKFDFSKTEVLVIDNNSTDDTAAVCQTAVATFPQLTIRHIKEYNQGVGFARTRGAQEAKGDIVAYIDDDCLADENWLIVIAEFYTAHPDAMSSGGKITPRFLVPMANWYGKYFWGLVGNYDLGKTVFQMTGVRYPAGANMHFRKAAFIKYGAFDGKLGRSGSSLMAGEEKAMYLKLIAAREKVYYLPGAVVYHHVEGNKFDTGYVHRHSMGIGASERLMAGGNTGKLILKFAEYVAKLGYAICYGLCYLIKGQPSKMAMLVKFRWWVLEGFFKPGVVKNK